jgi:hypothetical protein
MTGKMPPVVDGRIFRVAEWGEVGAANLFRFVTLPDRKRRQSLAVHKSTAGVAGGVVERIRRVR